jgi:FlaA1/EpsC-like NDP-sugar epimerase
MHAYSQPFLSLTLLKNVLFRLRNRHFLALDALLFLCVPALALALRLDRLLPPPHYYASLVVVTLLFAAVKLLTFYLAGLYSRYWRYASIDELVQLTGAASLAFCLQIVLFVGVLQPTGAVAADFPRSLPLLDGLLTLLLTGSVRYSVRVAERLRQRCSGHAEPRRLVIVGAGEAGVALLTELQRNSHLGLLPVAFIDDDDDKHGANIRGVPVAGDRRQLARIIKETRAKQVVIAMPHAPGKVIREITQTCEQVGLKPRIMPGIGDLLNGRSSANQLREVDIEDLLRREAVHINIRAVRALIQGKRVLVTGGGGSIGSELCRQILSCRPASLVILGHGENSIFALQNELQKLAANTNRSPVDSKRSPVDSKRSPVDSKRSPVDSSRSPVADHPQSPAVHTVIADIRFPERMQHLFAEHRPQIVFHTAAHKHVPLMEENPGEAIANNVLGTRNLLQAALAMNVSHFVMISTDKAVNPTSIMGASKRVAELLVYQTARKSGRPFVAVRFGNVLGSRGSVVPTFKQQIAAGGPVTVTDPEMVRYFMTIPEAVQLVLQAAVLGKGQEVFALDMGQPVKIVDLASDLIRLSGLQVGRDIEIVFTGRRPGEKLFEEVFTPAEDHQCTAHEKIFIARNATTYLPPDFEKGLRLLAEAAACNDREAVLAGLQRLIPEFQPAPLLPPCSVHPIQAQPAADRNGHLRPQPQGPLSPGQESLAT